MRRNEPVTQHEVKVDPRRPLVSKTDLKGRITYANPAFIDISGFSVDELIGAPHNLVRHPDMPPAAFADLWRTAQSGQPWRAIVKNRCKNGDHYWVEAFVTPLMEEGRHIGYMSVRNTATREQIAAAQALYAAVNAGQRTFTPTRWPQALALRWRLAAVLAASVLPLMIALAWPAARWPLAAAGLLAALGGGAWLLASWRQPLQALSSAFACLAEGNFRTSVPTHAPAEFAQLLLQLEAMRINLRAVMADVVSAAGRVEQQATGAAGDARVLADQAQQQAEGVAGVAAALEQLTVSVGEIHDATRTSAGHATQTVALTDRGGMQMREARQATHQVVTVVDEASRALDELAGSVQAINTVTQTIREIADQTNLVALNAAIEAARAGESGRGFAVVADEVRKLAERTSVSTGTITDTIRAIETRTEGATDVMRSARQFVQHGTVLIESSADSLAQIEAASRGVEATARDINAMLDQQTRAAHEVSSNMERMSTLAERNHASIDDVGRAAAELSAVSQALHQLVRHFERSL
ncbi:methyl-accepting chemotaxis protein [Chitinolyticbacter albus]|uniref:methyl-accepting chemotaxis protein n=1 Tax=Chitinolyticbacter albus TaxID=2961951 RepID=UPI00210CC863|nr:PAS domain-containing methyl-accepting chemotaxis protein [Chitinolyticbacter albus]